MSRKLKPMPAPETINCWACRDRGMIIMREIKIDKDTNDSVREDYAVYCSSCGAGNDKYYHGKNNAKYKTEYYTASISSCCDIDKLKAHNKEIYIKGNYVNWYKIRLDGNEYIFEREFII